MTPVFTVREVTYPDHPAAALCALGDGREIAWLDSASHEQNAGGATSSLICWNPVAVLEQYDGRDAVLHIAGRRADSDADGWRLWRRATERIPTPPPGPLSLTPGWVGYVGFEMARFLERLPASHREDLGLPLLRMALYERGIVLDHENRRAHLVVCDGVRAAVGVQLNPPNETVAEWEDACSRDVSVDMVACPEPRLELPRADYLRMIGRALDYIAAGDVYQVNLAQRLRFSGVGDHLALYAQLRRANPAPYGALLRWPGGAVASLSPELFLLKRGQDVLTQPIKGTMPRTGDAVLDRAYRRELLESKKDAAELAMIIDLHRNDLGRVCEYGSVRVRDARRLEAHPTVFHTVADVIGRLRDDRSALDLLAACFPAGSISGVPKIRALEIIDELEPVARGAYTGAVGVLGLDGSMTFNVAIRTLQICGDQATLYVGGGIVADSVPADEYDETFAKARGIVEGMSGVRGTLVSSSNPERNPCVNG